MKKKLYFVVEKEIASDNETLTGNKTITVYDIVNNKTELFASIDGVNEDKSTDLIENYLEDNGHGDEDFEFIQL